MKSVRIQSYKNRSKDSWNKYSARKKDISYAGRPTPLDFDAFIPWFCLELQVPKNVIITRNNQVEYKLHSSKASKESSKSSKLKSKIIKLKSSTIKSEHGDTKTSELSKSIAPTSPAAIEIKDAIHLSTYYDKKGRLVEIEIKGCPFLIHRKVIQAVNLCLPFHSGLTKLSIKKGGVDQIILYEIGKLLPHSNITDICLDDSFVPEGNYSILLDIPSHIQYLSLKRCGINDDECKKIASKIDLNGPAVNTLLLLDLTSNKINDKGAQDLGEVLKKNRNLLHLNLSGNNISDIGAAFILKYLKEFSLTFDDVKDKKFRRFTYLKTRAINYQKCLEEENNARLNKNSKTTFILPETSIEDLAEKKTDEITGEYEDPFMEDSIRRERDRIYAVGNLSLCSLNFAYNNLTFLSLRKILEVLKYQTEIIKTSHRTGLMRVVIDGNNIPKCEELDEIEVLLKKSILENEQYNASLLSLTNSTVKFAKRK